MEPSRIINLELGHQRVKPPPHATPKLQSVGVRSSIDYDDRYRVAYSVPRGATYQSYRLGAARPGRPSKGLTCLPWRGEAGSGGGGSRCLSSIALLHALLGKEQIMIIIIFL